MAGSGGPSVSFGHESLRARTRSEVAKTGPRVRHVRRGRRPLDSHPGMIHKADSDRQILDDTDAETAQLRDRPDPAAQEETRRSVRSGRHDHGVRGQPPAVRDDPDRPPTGDLDPVDECVGDNRQVRTRPCLVEIRERRVPANGSHGVDGRRSDADGRVEVVEIRESRESDARTGLEQRAMERRQVVRAICPRADRSFGPA